jgi:plastocyanin
VFAINPPMKTFKRFLERAMAAPIPTSTPSPVDSAPKPKKTHKVVVGGKPSHNADPVLKYYPETVDAKPGDVIEFNFRANAHTVTQSTFENPCTGIEGGFKTGLLSNLKDTDRKIIRKFVVPDTKKPLWFYCGAPNHCKKGMVFAINAGGKFEQFKKKAMKS